MLFLCKLANKQTSSIAVSYLMQMSVFFSYSLSQLVSLFVCLFCFSPKDDGHISYFAVQLPPDLGDPLSLLGGGWERLTQVCGVSCIMGNIAADKGLLIMSPYLLHRTFCEHAKLLTACPCGSDMCLWLCGLVATPLVSPSVLSMQSDLSGFFFFFASAAVWCTVWSFVPVA